VLENIMTLLNAKIIARAVVAAAALLVGGGVAFAQDYSNMSCDDLWEARNQIYADEGFCFKTDAALQEFGHRCYPPYGRLNHHEQREVNEIQQAESDNDCGD
jgi:hypothetical protein